MHSVIVVLMSKMDIIFFHFENSFLKKNKNIFSVLIITTIDDTLRRANARNVGLRIFYGG